MASKEEKRRKRIKVVASTVFAGIFIASIVVIGLIFSQKKETTIEQEWYKKATIYHIYVPSFKDSNGDGFGDLQGKEASSFLYHILQTFFAIIKLERIPYKIRRGIIL